VNIIWSFSSAYNRDRRGPHGRPPPTPPGIRITYQGGSVDFFDQFGRPGLIWQERNIDFTGSSAWSMHVSYDCPSHTVRAFTLSLATIAPQGSLAVRFPATMSSADFSHVIGFDYSRLSQFASHATLQGNMRDLPG
jgi:hypothetical protein